MMGVVQIQKYRERKMTRLNNKKIAKSKYQSMTKLIRASVIGVMFFMVMPNAWAVTEADVMKADPKKALLGRANACNKHDVEKFASFYAAEYRNVFWKVKSAKEATYRHECGNFPTVSDQEVAELTKGLRVFVKKTDHKTVFSQQPIFKLCGTKKDIKYCNENGGWDFSVILENGQVKFVTD
jgi:hypothetical protein